MRGDQSKATAAVYSAGAIRVAEDAQKRDSGLKITRHLGNVGCNLSACILPTGLGLNRWFNNVQVRPRWL